MIGLPLVLRQLQRWDQRRNSVPGEHWAAFGTGLMLLGTARRQPSTLLRLAAGVAGAAFVWRAVSGRDGFVRKVREKAQAVGDNADG